MAEGIEVYNSLGVPQVIDLSFNLVLVQQGTLSVGSNTAATGASGSVALPAKGEPYVVFIRCDGGNACILSSTTSGFNWFMPQGTTSFLWWAYARSANTGNVGMQVWNSDGTLRYDVGLRALDISSMQGGGAAPSNSGPATTDNVIINPNTLTIPAGHAVAFSDPGYFMEIYTGVAGATLCPNMRFWPCVNTNGAALKINYGRRYPNITTPAGVSFQSVATKTPSFVLTTASV